MDEKYSLTESMAGITLYTSAHHDAVFKKLKLINTPLAKRIESAANPNPNSNPNSNSNPNPNLAERVEAVVQQISNRKAAFIKAVTASQGKMLKKVRWNMPNPNLHPDPTPNPNHNPDRSNIRSSWEANLDLSDEKAAEEVI